MPRLKSICLLFLISLLSHLPLHSQDYRFRLQTGIMRSGLAMNNAMQNEDPEDQQAKFRNTFNLYFSANCYFRLIGKVSMYTGLELYNRGARVGIDTVMTTPGLADKYYYHIDQREILRYLMVPIVINRRIDIGKHALNLHLGFGINYLLGASYKGVMQVNHYQYKNPTLEYQKISSNEQKLRGPAEGWKPWDFSLLLGAGYRYILTDDLALGIEYRPLYNRAEINHSRHKNWYKDKQGSVRSHSPNIRNTETHVISLAVYLSPKAFLGLETNKP